MRIHALQSTGVTVLVAAVVATFLVAVLNSPYPATSQTQTFTQTLTPAASDTAPVAHSDTQGAGIQLAPTQVIAAR